MADIHFSLWAVTRRTTGRERQRDAIDLLLAPGRLSKYTIKAVVIYNVGRWIGLITPCLIITRGLVAVWKVDLVVHSGPIGSLKALSYCCLDSKGCGSWDARYLLFWCKKNVSECTDI